MTALDQLLDYWDQHGRIGLLALWCMREISVHPRTPLELAAMLNENPGAVHRALQTLTVYWDAQKQVVCLPEYHWLQRRRRPKPGKGYRYFLTNKGRSVIDQTHTLQPQ